MKLRYVLALLALASPAFAQSLPAPDFQTQAADNNTTKAATTAFTLGQASNSSPLVNGAVAAGTSTRFSRSDHVHPIDTSRAPTVSPTFTGTPAAPTAAVDTNSTQLSTTAFVIGQAASASPLVDGAVAVGTSTRFARADHVHPTDTSRAPTVSPTFTGTPVAPTPAVGTNTTQLATTAYVKAEPVAAGQMPAHTGSCTSTAGTVALTCEQDGAWISYTSALACTTGSLSSASISAFYKIIGTKTVAVRFNLVIGPSGVGTCAGAINMQLPFTPNGNQVMTMREAAVVGSLGYVSIVAGATAANLVFYNNVGAIGNNYNLIATGVYEIT